MVRLAEVPLLSTCTANVAVHLAYPKLNTTVSKLFFYLNIHRKVYVSVARSNRSEGKYVPVHLPKPARWLHEQPSVVYVVKAVSISQGFV